MKNIQLSLAHQRYWPVNISHIIFSMIEVNQSWIKSWSKIESITAIYMSTKSGSSKQSTSSQIYISMFIPCWSYTVFTHVQRNLIHQIKGWKLLIPQTEHLFGKRLKPHRKPGVFLLPSCLEGYGRSMAGNDYPSSSASSSEDTGDLLDSKLWCSRTESHKHHILESKATLSKAASMSCSADRHFNTDLWYCYSYRSATVRVSETWRISSTASANSVFECNITEATQVLKRKWWISEIRQMSITSWQEVKLLQPKGELKAM